MARSPEGGERGLEAGAVVGGVGGVVEGDRRVQLGDHAPQRLAQQRGRGHRGGAAQQVRVGRGLEVGFEQGGALVGVHAGVGGEAAEVEQGRVEAGVFPVDQPEPVAVVEDVGRQQVVVAEHDLDRADGRFERVGSGQQRRQVGAVRAAALVERVAVVANHLEHPEHRRRAAEVLRDLAVAGAHERGEAGAVAGRAHRVGGHRRRLDEVEHQRAGLPVAHRRARGRRRGRRGWRRARRRARCCARARRRRCARGSGGRHRGR